MHGEIHVRALLLRPDHLRRALVSRRPRQRRADPVSQEMPEIHLDLGPVVLKRAQIDILALRFRGIGGRPGHARREILDRQYPMPGLEHPCEQGDQIKPFPRRPFERAVVPPAAPAARGPWLKPST